MKYWCSKQSEVLQQKLGPEMYPYFYVQYCVQNNIGHKNDTHKVQNANYNIELKIMLINTKLKIHWAQNNVEFKILLKIIQDNNRIILRWVHAWGMWGKVGRKGGHYRTYCDLLLICRGLHKISVCCVLQGFPVFRITGHIMFWPILCAN